jgi:hypothetical protein
MLSQLAMLPLLSASLRSTAAVAQTQRDPLPSWNEGATKASILDFVARARHDAKRTVLRAARSAYRHLRQ